MALSNARNHPALRPQINTYHLVKKNVKIGPVDPEITGLQEIIKNKEKRNI